MVDIQSKNTEKVSETRNHPMVSVTMSAYNATEFLRECLENILGQTFTDFELIIVDDGSSDSTREILLEYADRDARIHLILKDCNEGLAIARNDAIAAAIGKYITFIDADDIPDINLLYRAVGTAESTNADMVIWDYVPFTNSADLKPEPASKLSLLNASDKLDLLDLPAFAWTKLIRTSVVKKLSVTFPEKLTYQDMLVHWHLVTQLDQIILLPEKLYFYRQQPAATTSGKSWKRADIIIIFGLIKEYLINSDLFDLYKDTFIKKELNHLYGVYDVVSDDLKPQALILIKDKITSDHWEYINSKKEMRWRARAMFKQMQGSKYAQAKLMLWCFVRSIYRRLKAFN